MKAPKGLLDRDGRLAKIVTKLKVNDEEVHEFSYPSPDAVFPPETGITSACFALASPGDLISIGCMVNNKTADVVDIYVDGILRATQPIVQQVQGFANLNIKRVVYRGVKAKGRRRKGVSMYEMVVKERDTSHDIKLSGDVIASAVGTIVLKYWQKNPLLASSIELQVNKTDTKTEKPVGPPNYDSHNDWYDLNRNISSAGPPPPFEIGFSNPTQIHRSKNGSGAKERVNEVANRKAEEHTLFAEFVFHLRSTANLISLGYQDLPVCHASSTTSYKSEIEVLSTATGPAAGTVTELKLEGDSNSDLSDDFDDSVSLIQQSAASIKSAPVFKSDFKNHESFTQLPKKLTEFPPRPTLKDIFQKLPEVDFEIIASEPDSLIARAISESEDQIKDVADSNNMLSPTERLHFEVNDIAVERRKKSQSAEMPVDSTKQLSDEESQQKAITRGIPTQKLSLAGVQDGMKVTKPFVPGLKAAPAHKAWLERGPTQDFQDLQFLAQVDHNLRDDVVDGKSNSTRGSSSSTQEQDVASVQKERASIDTSSQCVKDSRENEPSTYVGEPIIQPEIDNSSLVCASQRADRDMRLNKAQSSSNECLDSMVDKSPLTYKRSTSQVSDTLSEATELATEADIQEMVKRSQPIFSQTSRDSVPDFDFQSSTLVHAYHSRPSPILGSSAISDCSSSVRSTPHASNLNVDLRVHSNSSLNLTGPQQKFNRLVLSAESEGSPSVSLRNTPLSDKGENHGGFSRSAPMGSWPHRDSDLQVKNLIADGVGESTANFQHPLTSRNTSPMVVNKIFLANEMNERSVDAGQVLLQDLESFPSQNLSSNTANRKRKADMTDARLSRDAEGTNKTNKPPHERKTAEVAETKKQAVSATKRKAEYTTYTLDDRFKLASEELPTTTLGKVAMVTAKLKTFESSPNMEAKLEDIPSNCLTPLSVLAKQADRFRASTAEIDEIEQKKAVVHMRIAGAEQKKRALQQKLDRVRVEEKRRELRKLEEQAAVVEREISEMEEAIAKIYANRQAY